MTTIILTEKQQPVAKLHYRSPVPATHFRDHQIATLLIWTTHLYIFTIILLA